MKDFEYQGKRPDQIQRSAEGFALAFICAVAIILTTLLTQLF